LFLGSSRSHPPAYDAVSGSGKDRRQMGLRLSPNWSQVYGSLHDEPSSIARTRRFRLVGMTLPSTTFSPCMTFTTVCQYSWKLTDANLITRGSCGKDRGPNCLIAVSMNCRSFEFMVAEHIDT
jgi:hypothetical protein